MYADQRIYLEDSNVWIFDVMLKVRRKSNWGVKIIIEDRLGVMIKILNVLIASWYFIPFFFFFSFVLFVFRKVQKLFLIHAKV